MAEPAVDLGARRRRRRSSEALRTDLLAAAADVFAERGYGGATTKEIADRAGTPQASIYRHYGSKAELFVAAVAQPFNEMINEYAESFTEHMRSDRDPYLIAHGMISGLYDHLQERQQAVFALVASSREPEAQEAINAAVSRLDEMFETLHQFGVELWEQGAPYRVERAELWQRLVTGMMVSATALDSLFMPRGEDAWPRDQLVEVITDFVTYGFLDSRNGPG
jgi:AcrR family transcriptional regulator